MYGDMTILSIVKSFKNHSKCMSFSGILSATKKGKILAISSISEAEQRSFNLS